MQTMKSSTASANENGSIWDLPIRIFHWGTALSVMVAWISSDTPYFQLHLFSGYLLLILLIFRLIWGFTGSHYAHFRHFSYPWSAVRQHLRGLLSGNAPSMAGHNPAGGWMIFLLLGILLLITITGTLTLGGEERLGPLQGIVTIETGILLHQVHQVAAWALALLIPLHLAGVLIERILTGRSIVRAMVTGHYSPYHSEWGFRRHPVATTALLLMPLLAFALSNSENSAVSIYKNSDWRDDSGYALWETECGDCHTLHHPSLLPQRSWHRMMSEQHNHFDEDLSIDPQSIQIITDYLQQHAAELAQTEAAWRIDNSISPNQFPIQITETPFWKETHEAIDLQYWDHPSVGEKLHCDGCHHDAADGTFHNRWIEIPDEAST